MPYSFLVLPSPPRSSSVVVEESSPNTLSVRWASSPADGADAWIVAIRLNMQEVVRREVNTPMLEEGIDGLFETLSDADILLEIHAKSTIGDGIISKNYASWSSHATMYPPFSPPMTPLQETFHDFDEAQGGCTNPNSPPAFRDSSELEYVDNERSLALMAAMKDDTGHDEQQMDAEEREVADQVQANKGGVPIPIYDELVAKPSLPVSPLFVWQPSVADSI